ncbi:TWiK family of potassium channels protein 18-like isoform X1 [Artemia franciscana]|uniref:Potassium channel domain-containing protein n=1 Tax=Artemia franciscana TaxID=6661 RepID=A0AA88HZA5_ARTSF|nr:hypothetical protein QYM36_004028 [Artemia franciscana]
MDRKRSMKDRGSLRSRGSSSADDTRTKIKDCCRKFVAFMCTQVGVGGLVVTYAVMGAFAFMFIEKDVEHPMHYVVDDMRGEYVEKIWVVTDQFNVLHKDRWYTDVNKILTEYQMNMSDIIKQGYDGKTSAERWTFPSALMYTLSVFTMIGFGHLVPRTDWGKATTIMYACLGIPLYVLYFMNMGKVLASVFKWVYARLVRCSRQRSKPKRVKVIEKIKSEDIESNSDEEEEIIIVPSNACLWVMLIYLMTGTIMFAEWEQWDYIDACYFCVTSLCKIGMGDYVPGSNSQLGNNQTKLVINFVYLLVGMGIVAMCYNLMKEEVMYKLRMLKADIMTKLQDMGDRWRGN